MATRRASRGRFFVRGLAVLLPSIVTLWILWQAFVFVFKNVAEPINAGIRAGVIRVIPMLSEERRPEWYMVTPAQARQYRRDHPEASAETVSEERVQHLVRVKAFEQYWDQRWHLEATGLVVAIVLIYLAGALLGGFVGRKLYARIEGVIARIPGFKQIYPHVKQMVELVLGDTPKAFQRVVMVQFPRPGSWVIAFVTGPAFKEMAEDPKSPSLSVFIPSTPTPFTGYTIMVPASEVIDVPITIDQALRYLITGGVLMPEGHASPAKPGVVSSELPRQPD